MSAFSRRTVTGFLLAALMCPAVTPAAETLAVMPAAEARARIEKGGVTVLDVRTPEEFAAGHIAGAVNVPLDAIEASPRPELLPDLNRPVLVYCRSGRRSALAVALLLKAGYREVINIGGISALNGRFAP